MERILALGCLAAMLHGVAATSALMLKKLEIDDLKENEDIWNAAATFAPEYGWVVAAHITQCYWNFCADLFDARARPWVAQLGSEHAPDLSRFKSGSRFAYDEESFWSISGVNGSDMLNEDFRPFTWDGKLMVSFSHRRNTIWPEYMAIGRLDLSLQTLVLQQVFEEQGWQKNWGFFQEGDKRLILHSVLPCTKIYEHQATGEITPVFEACYTDPGQAVMEATLLNVSKGHNSGHPVLWTKNGAAEEAPDEYLLMVHCRDTSKTGGYNHWLLRMNARSRALTHVSHGVVFGRALAHDDGRMPEAVIVGSFSLVTVRGKQYLSIFGGQGDTFSVHDHIELERVKWLDVQGLLHSDIDTPSMPEPA